MQTCSTCGGPKGGIGIPLYGDPRCVACLRAADKAEAEARGEKYQRFDCSFGWNRRQGGSSCTGTNWEWTRAQVSDALTRKGPDVDAGIRKRWDWALVDGPGKSMIFTRQAMPGEKWGTFARRPMRGRRDRMGADMKPRAWTADDTATLRRMAGAGYSDGEIARHLGRDRRTVCDVRVRLGIAPGSKPAIVAMWARLHRRRPQIAA